MFFLHRCVHTYMRAIAVIAIDSNAFLQYEFNTFFTYTVAKVYQL